MPSREDDSNSEIEDDAAPRHDGLVEMRAAAIGSAILSAHCSERMIEIDTDGPAPDPTRSASYGAQRVGCSELLAGLQSAAGSGCV
jgi:hypothetical protein